MSGRLLMMEQCTLEFVNLNCIQSTCWSFVSGEQLADKVLAFILEGTFQSLCKWMKIFCKIHNDMVHCTIHWVHRDNGMKIIWAENYQGYNCDYVRVLVLHIFFSKEGTIKRLFTLMQWLYTLSMLYGHTVFCSCSDPRPHNCFCLYWGSGDKVFIFFLSE